MRNRGANRGFASVEYLAAVGVVGIIFAGLVALRPQRVERRTPVDVIPPIVRLLGRPVDNLTPRPARPNPSGRPALRPRPRPPRREPGGPATVLLPEWWGR